MNNIFAVFYILGFFSSTIWAKTISGALGTEEINYPRYAFNYAITDPLTKDNKAQWEERDGDKVNGAYSLLEPDGNLRVVEYTADDISGFSAIVNTITAALKSPQPLLQSLIVPLPDIPLLNLNPVTYGFGAANLGVNIPNVKVSGSSLAWDPKTGSFGGWIPINRPSQKIAKATILRKKYVNGRLHKVVYGPIPLPHKSVILIKKKKINYD